MGLDTFARRTPDGELTEEDSQAFGAVDAQLCGGIWSGDDGSFRGKVYSDVVERVSDVSLYQEWIPPETVREMADAFARCDPEVVARDMEGEVHATTASEIRSLGAFLRVCADRGLGLAGWW
jgi:hypothetical protein